MKRGFTFVELLVAGVQVTAYASGRNHVIINYSQFDLAAPVRECGPSVRERQ